MKEYKEFSEMFPEDLDIKDLNEFIKVILNKAMEDEKIEDYLECWGEYIGELIIIPDELSSDHRGEKIEFLVYKKCMY